MDEPVDIVSGGRAEMYSVRRRALSSSRTHSTMSKSITVLISPPTGIIDHVCPCLAARLEWNRGYGKPLRSAFAMLDIHTSCSMFGSMGIGSGAVHGVQPQSPRPMMGNI